MVQVDPAREQPTPINLVGTPLEACRLLASYVVTSPATFVQVIVSHIHESAALDLRDPSSHKIVTGQYQQIREAPHSPAYVALYHPKLQMKQQ